MTIDFSREFTADWFRLERTGVLNYAGRLTQDASVPEAVLGNASVLQKWLEAAPTRDDRRDRLQALDQANSNRESGREPDDDPARLIAEADVYYAFIKGA